MIQQYAPLERALLEQAHHKGNIMIGPAPNAQGEYRLAISHYLQQGDNMTLVGAEKADESVDRHESR